MTVTGERPAIADVWALGRPWFWPVSLLPYGVGAYHLLLGRRPSFGRIVVVSVLFLAPSAVFALAYTGVL